MMLMSSPTLNAAIDDELFSSKYGGRRPLRARVRHPELRIQTITNSALDTLALPLIPSIPQTPLAQAEAKNATRAEALLFLAATVTALAALNVYLN
mmetsp:Transcript_11556/g.34419  ORF Transcript_11556/g.34419 Transcript_11556/m.34419 type:complete len:96 (-) Transcript_11556:22-309(-)